MATLLRYNGEDRATGEYHYHGQTALLDNVQAAVLDVKLRYLPGWIAHRRRIAAAYHRGLAGITQLRIPQFDESRCQDIFQNYVIRTTVREPLRAYLKEQRGRDISPLAETHVGTQRIGTGGSGCSRNACGSAGTSCRCR